MKLREKKINAFGKSIPVIAVILMVLTAGIAGAALVSYLSNTVTTTATVESPIKLELYASDGALIDGDFDLEILEGGESFNLYKVAQNQGDAAVPFAIAMVFKGKDVGMGVMVECAAPLAGQKVAIGHHLTSGASEIIWDRDDYWYEVDGVESCLLGAHDPEKVADYIFWADHNSIPTFSVDPDAKLNTNYVDAVIVSDIEGNEYYVVIFGGTIGDTLIADEDPRTLESEITSWGWWSSDEYHLRGADEPCVMPGINDLDTKGYDLGKIRIIFRSNFVSDDPETPDIVETVNIGMRVVTPGCTIGEIIEDMAL
ncbi:MAG: hypothetical protein IB616_01205 [Methanosarcinales archaeon]|nr:MAG: hypothetical protein IB616_01205 [Methanosarcinales archaeon]